MPISYNIDLPIGRSYRFEDAQFTYILTTPNEQAPVTGGALGVMQIQVGDTMVGSALAFDASQANSVKLAGPGDYIFGRMETYTWRASAGVATTTVARSFIDRLPVDTGLVGAAIPVIGSTVEGSTTLGTVRAAATQNYDRNVVRGIEVDGLTGVTYAIVEKI